MAHRHKMHEKKAKGGGVAPKRDANKEEYNGQGSKLMKEAHEMKRGGKAHGHKSHHRLDKKARGGKVHASGKDATKSPFSAAHTGSGSNPAENPPAHKHGGHVGHHRGK